MSKTTTKTESAGAAQADALEAQTEQPAPADAGLVVKPEKLVFGAYDDGAEFKGKLDIRSMFAPGFDPTPYEFTWIRYNRVDEATSRYFTKVTKMTHSKWFKANAFDNMTGAVSQGRGAPGTPVGLPEVELFVRLKEVADAEREAMLTMSEKNRNPVQSSQLQAEMDGISKAIGSDFMRGSGVTTETKSGWQ